MRIRGNIPLLSLLAAALLGLGFCGARALAEDYNVNAVVPYATPNQAATVDSPVSGAVVHDAQQTVSGTCQTASPPNVVSVWRDGQLLGSAACLGGSYSLNVVLQLGQNNLVVRTANLNGIYGPDNAVIVVSFELPVVAEPLPTGVNQPTTTSQQTSAINKGGLSNLQITTQTPFSVLSPDNNVVSIQVVVAGGQHPYVLQLNWGDGSTESRSIEQPGTYEFTHTYRVQRSYTVHVQARDVLGSYSEYVYAVVSNKQVVAPSQKSTTKAGTATGYHISARWYYWLLGIFLIFFLVMSYWFGWHRAQRRFEQKAATKPEPQTTAAGKKRKNGNNKS